MSGRDVRLYLHPESVKPQDGVPFFVVKSSKYPLRRAEQLTFG